MDGEITVAELRTLLDGGSADDVDHAADGAGVDGVGEGNGDRSGDRDGREDAPDADDTGAASLRVVDIRSRDAFTRGHIPGSENVPAGELVDRVEEFDGAGRVVTVCPHGKASVQAARLLGSYEGVDGPVESLHGGLEAWDGPLETDGTHSGEAGETDGDRGSSAPF